MKLVAIGATVTSVGVTVDQGSPVIDRAMRSVTVKIL